MINKRVLLRDIPRKVLVDSRSLYDFSGNFTRLIYVEFFKTTIALYKSVTKDKMIVFVFYYFGTNLAVESSLPRCSIPTHFHFQDR